MSTPITWRNVQGDTNPTGIANVFDLSRRTINDGLASFGNILQQTEAVDANNQQAQQEGARQSFLQALQQARTPEELTALQGTGQLDEMRTRLTAAQRLQVMDAERQRLTSLRQGITTDNDFNASQRALREAPIRDQIGVLIAQGKTAEATALATSSGIANVAPLVNQATVAARTKLLESREDTRFSQDTERYGVTSKLDAIKLKDTQQREKDLQDSLALKNQLGQVSAAHQQKVEAVRVAAGEVGKGLGFATNSDGTLDMSALDTAQRAKVNEQLKARGLGPVDLLEGGDTNAKAAFLDSLKKSGKFRPDQLNDVSALADTAFDSSGYASIGNDALTKAAKKAGKDEIEREAKFRLGEIATPETMAGLLDAGREMIKGLAEPGSWRYENYMRQLSTFIDEGGYKAKDASGKETRFLPPAEQLKLLLGKVDTSNGLGPLSFYGSDITTPLQKWADRSGTKETAEAELKAFARRTADKIRREPKL